MNQLKTSYRSLFSTPFLAGAAALAAVAAVSIALRVSEQQAANARMAAAAREVEAHIVEQIDALYSMRAFMANAGSVTRGRFRNYLDAYDLAKQSPGFQGVGFAIAVDPEDLQAAKAVESLLGARYGVGKAPWPDTDQAIRYSIVILEPDDARNRAALAYDMYSDAVRRDAMDRAIRTGAPAATGVVRLKQEIDSDVQAGFLIYLPMEKTDDPDPIIADSAPVAGFVYAPIRGADLFEAVLGQMSAYDLRVAAWLGERSDETLLYSSFDSAPNGAAHDINIADMPAALVLSEPASIASGLLQPSSLVLILGLPLALVFAGFIGTRRQKSATVALLAEEKQLRASEREVALREMKHRMNNSIARIQAIAHMSARSATSLDDFMKGFVGRLGAMARAQNMATATKWEQTTLGEIIRGEVLQIAPADGDQVTLKGDDIALAGADAQAIGLVIHELATNAAKYGAIRHNGGLSVAWRRDGDAVVIDWTESGLDQAPEFERNGFGSRLCKLILEDQLGGAFERRANDDGLAATLRFTPSRN